MIDISLVSSVLGSLVDQMSMPEVVNLWYYTWKLNHLGLIDFSNASLIADWLLAIASSKI